MFHFETHFESIHPIFYFINAGSVGNKSELKHDKSNKMTCAQQRLGSARVSTWSDQSLRCTHEEALGPLATHTVQIRCFSLISRQLQIIPCGN